jgi:hypothetical protein
VTPPTNTSAPTTTLTPADAITAASATLASPSIVGPSPDGRTWPQALAGGAAGIALLHIERAVAGHGDEATAHEWIRAAASEPVSVGPNSDPFHGAPALAFVLHTASPLGGYRRARAQLAEAATNLTRQRLAAAHARIDRGEPLPMYEFDLVHGLTGLAAYHLHAHPDRPINQDLVAYLTRITEPLGAGQAPRFDRPPWWLRSGLGGTAHPDFPHGHGNLGMAHGISAVIAVLAYAVLHGHDRATSRRALDALCAWTDLHRQDDPTESWWPGYVVPGGEPTAHRPSWCYGTAGTARAQQMAGLAQHDTTRQQRAEDAMLSAIATHRGRLPAIGLCHGKAGLLQAACRMAEDSTDQLRSAQLKAQIPDLADQLARQVASQPGATPELMDGSAGAVLALHTALTGSPATGWDAFLALS